MGDSTVVSAPRLPVVATIRRGLELGAREWRLLVGVAFVIEVPIAILSVGSVALIDLDFEPAFSLGNALTLLFLILWGTLGHHALLAVVERIEAADRHGYPKERLGTILRGLPYGRLLLAHVVVTSAFELGVAAFVVPGVLVAVWTAPVFPLITMENRTVRATIARSFTIVRGNAWPVLGIVLCSPLAVYIVGLAASRLVHEVVHGDWPAVLAHALTEAVLAPIGAAITVVATFELVEIDSAARRSRGAQAVGKDRRPGH